jgi:hypothetical protein
LFAIIQFSDIFYCLISSGIDINSCEVTYNLRTAVLVVFNLQINSLYRENIYFVDRSTALRFTATGARTPACSGVHVTFANESACLTTDNILADPYFTYVLYRNISCSKVYCTMTLPHCSLTVTENKWLMELITAACLLLTYHILPA